MHAPAPLTRRRFLAAAGLGLVAPGCLGGGAATTPGRPEARPAPLRGPIVAAAPPGSVAPQDAAEFTAARDAKVDLVTHPGGPALARLVAAVRADVVLARQDDVAALVAENLLLPLEHGLLPNLAHVAGEFLDLDYDPGNRYSAPARHGAFGFAYRADTVTEAPATWAEFYALLPRYSHAGILFLPGPIEPVAAALAAIGADINSDDPDDLAQARALLLNARPHINGFSPNPAAAFTPEALVLAMGSASAFTSEAPTAQFVLPSGGLESWIDGWVVPATSRHPVTAQAFIDHQLSPHVQARDWQLSDAPATVAAAADLVPPDLRAAAVTRFATGVGHGATFSLVSPVGLAQRAQIWAEIGPQT